MRFVIVTGMSGAGSTTTLKILEDIGYFCIDNLPVSLMVPLAKLLHMPDSTMRNVAVAIDIRNGDALDELQSTLERYDDLGYPYEIIYLDCSTPVLVKRYKETRRNHPLSRYGRIEDGIAAERERMTFLRARANYILDTGNLLTRELRAQLERIFVDDGSFKSLMVTVMSFGYKYGIPSDADLVFDVRFMPNPYYISELRLHTGNDEVIQQFVKKAPQYLTFMEKLSDMLDFLLPNYIDEGKNALVIAIGCTGGRHRSVTVANEVYALLQKHADIGVRLEHRDITRSR